MLANFFVPILQDGWRFIAIFAGVDLPCRADRRGLAVLAAVRADPVVDLFLPRPAARRAAGRRLLVAPADGLVQMVVHAVPPAELGLGDQPLTRVSIFLSVFDVHINRTPCAGTVDVVAYRPGKFLNAAADKASEDNERMAIALRRTDGREVGFVQIAGWVARRIVCYVKPGQALAGRRALRPYPLRQPHRPLFAGRRATAGGARTAHDRRRDGHRRARPGPVEPRRASEF